MNIIIITAVLALCSFQMSYGYRATPQENFLQPSEAHNQEPINTQLIKVKQCLHTRGDAMKAEIQTGKPECRTWQNTINSIQKHRIELADKLKRWCEGSEVLFTSKGSDEKLQTLCGYLESVNCSLALISLDYILNSILTNTVIKDKVTVPGTEDSLSIAHGKWQNCNEGLKF